MGPQNVLSFTLSGQPEEYEISIDGVTQREKCPSFEHGLNELLRPYRP